MCNPTERIIFDTLEWALFYLHREREETNWILTLDGVFHTGPNKTSISAWYIITLLFVFKPPFFLSSFISSCFYRGTVQGLRIQAMPSASWWRSELSAAKHVGFVTLSGWTTASSYQPPLRPPPIEVKDLLQYLRTHIYTSGVVQCTWSMKPQLHLDGTAGMMTLGSGGANQQVLLWKGTEGLSARLRYV